MAVAGLLVTGVVPLLAYFFDQAQGYTKTMSDILTGAFLLVVSRKDTLTQVQGDRFSQRSSLANTNSH